MIPIPINSRFIAKLLQQLGNSLSLLDNPRLKSWVNKSLNYLPALCCLFVQTVGYSQSTVPDSISHYRTMLAKRYKIGVSAHRGSSDMAPENTMATFQKVLQLQVDYIEIDVRTTKDNQLVILHDGKLDRTTNGIGPVNEQTLADLKKLSAAKGFGDSYQNERIPTLEEVCRLLAGWNAQHSAKTNLYIDCKAVSPEPLVAILTKYDLLTGAVFYGSDDYLLALQKTAPTAKLMPSLKQADALTSKIEKLHPYAFDLSWSAFSESVIKQIHQHGIRAFIDLLDRADTPEQYAKAAQVGIDVIQTDHVLSVYRTLAK